MYTLKDTKICCVFVTNGIYFDLFKNTCLQLITNGKYTGDITLIIGDDLELNDCLQDEFILNFNINVVKFANIKFTEGINALLESVNDDGRCRIKKFQWHKFHLFNEYFKKWNYIFYIDCGMKIYRDISPMINCAKSGKLLAQSDAYPTYIWKLRDQFDSTKEDTYNQLQTDYNINIDYFQTGILLYDTNIISDKLITNLYNLAIKYPITLTNEQAIMALYFTNLEPIWEQIQLGNNETFFYRYGRDDLNQNYIITKK